MDLWELNGFDEIISRLDSGLIKLLLWHSEDEKNVQKLLKYEIQNPKGEDTRRLKQNEVKWVIKPSGLYASLSEKGFLGTRHEYQPHKGTETDDNDHDDDDDNDDFMMANITYLEK